MCAFKSKVCFVLCHCPGHVIVVSEVAACLVAIFFFAYQLVCEFACNIDKIVEVLRLLSLVGFVAELFCDLSPSVLNFYSK